MTALYVPQAGDYPNAAQLNTWVPVTARRIADSAAQNNTTALVNDPVLIWPTPANTTWDFRLTVIYLSNATANLKWALTFPAGARVDFGIVAMAIGGGVLTTAQSAYTSGSAIGVGGAAFDEVVHIFGTIGVAGTAGNLQVQFGQNTANVSNTVIRAGASGTLKQVA